MPTKRDFVEVSARAVLSDSIGTVLTRASTGRRTEALTSAQQKDEADVVAWSKATGECEYAERFREALKHVDFQAEHRMVAYRGRQLALNQQYRSDEFGPPPNAGDGGRYNPPSNPALYLCTTPQGVMAELSPNSAGSGIYCQAFSFETARIRIADFTPPNLDGFLNFAFEYAEQAGDSNRRDYEFSQLLARLVKEAGFDGMIVPGVRGSLTNRYANFVIFRPSGGWLEWLAKEEPILLSG